MSDTPDPKKTNEPQRESVNSNPVQPQSDPQLSELDGLIKGGVAPQVHPEDLPENKPEETLKRDGDNGA